MRRVWKACILDLKPYVEVFSPLGAFVVSLYLAFIAWQQIKLGREQARLAGVQDQMAAQQATIAHNKLRLDLFDRRYKVYEAIKKFLSQITTHTHFEMDHLTEYNVGTYDADFLFEDEIAAYVIEIRKKALEMRMHKKLMNVSQGEQHTIHVEAESAALAWLSGQLTTLKSTFAPYLGFGKIKLAPLLPSRHLLHAS